MSENLKFWAKRAVRRTRLVLLSLFSNGANKSGWEKRMLFINLDAIGGIVVFTSVLKHYKKIFPGRKIYLLLRSDSGISPALVKEYADEVIMVNHKKFNTDPRYGYRFIKDLREIGFATIVEHNPHLEFSGKLIATELGAEKIIGYEGVKIDIEKPVASSYAKSYAYIQKKILPQYTDIIPNTIERWRKSDDAEYVPNIINHHIKIFEFASKTSQADYRPELKIEERKLPEGIQKNTYCLLSITTGAPSKEWELEKFAEISNYLGAKNIPVILVGTKNDVLRTAAFSKLVHPPIINLMGKTDIVDVATLIKNALFTFSNETSIPHMAIALKKPCLVVTGTWNLGMWTFYGYEDINKWVYQKNAPCMGDNGQCIVEKDRAAPCLTAIQPAEVKASIDRLLNYLATDKDYPKKSFAMDFGA